MCCPHGQIPPLAVPADRVTALLSPCDRGYCREDLFVFLIRAQRFPGSGLVAGWTRRSLLGELASAQWRCLQSTHPQTQGPAPRSGCLPGHSESRLLQTLSSPAFADPARDLLERFCLLLIWGLLVCVASGRLLWLSGPSHKGRKQLV